VLQKLIHLKNEMLRFKESLRPAESLPHTS
jgi:hypothetical protein